MPRNRVEAAALRLERETYKAAAPLTLRCLCSGAPPQREAARRHADGRKRRHEQRVWMPNIEPLVKEITDIGFKLLHHVDLTAIGYEYQFLFLFGK